MFDVIAVRIRPSVYIAAARHSSKIGKMTQREIHFATARFEGEISRAAFSVNMKFAATTNDTCHEL